MQRSLLHAGLTLLAAVMILALVPVLAGAATADELDRDATAALAKLYADAPAAEALGKNAQGVLVFPYIVKAGLMVGGQYGEGVLQQQGKAVAYYRTAGASFGLQAGAQAYGYALFFMSADALHYLDQSDGWEIAPGRVWSSSIRVWRRR
jgi:lipid-binding SYLF domain-containing protein